MTVTEASALCRAIWVALPTNQAKEAVLIVAAACPNLGVEFKEDLGIKGSLTMTWFDRTAEHTRAAHEYALAQVKREAELQKARLDAELEVEKHRQAILEIKARAEAAAKAPPGSLSIVPEAGDSSR